MIYTNKRSVHIKKLIEILEIFRVINPGVDANIDRDDVTQVEFILLVHLNLSFDEMSTIPARAALQVLPARLVHRVVLLVKAVATELVCVSCSRDATVGFHCRSNLSRS